MNKYLLKSIILIMSFKFFTGIFCCYAFAGILPVETSAQTKSVKEVYITLEAKEATLKTIFNEIEAKTVFRFSYLKGTLPDAGHLITLETQYRSVAYYLTQIANETGLIFKQVNATINVIVPQKGTGDQPPGKEQRQVPDQVISGKVTDENGEPMVGVNVLVKGTTGGTVTDVDGNYRLEVPDDATVLVFSFIGYNREEIAINARAIIDVALTPDITTLDEVLVSTGYWQTEERLNPGNIAKVTANEIEAQPVTTPLQALSGRVAGVIIKQTTGVPGAGIDIQIRGQNSLRRDGNNPLYIVDGVPYPSTSLVSSNVGGIVFNSVVRPINNINPADIESIEVLKDADATAIYGSRGANGVVLITTKKGVAGKTTLSFNHYTGVGEVSRKMDLLNTQQYREMAFEGLANDGFDPLPDFFKSFFPDLFAWDSTRNTDWQEELIGGTANYHNSQFSLSGGNSNTQFLFSGTYFRQSTVYPGDFALQRGSGHFNLNHQSTNQKFNTSMSMSYVSEKNELPRTDLTGHALQVLSPNAPEPFDEEGNLNFENNTFIRNPYAQLLRTYEGNTRNLISNMRLAYKILPGLTLKANLGYNNITIDEISIIPIRAQLPAANPTGFAGLGNSNSETWIIEPQAEYQKQLGKGKLSLLIGSTFQATKQELETILTEGYTSDALLGNINAAPSIDILDADFLEYRYNAIFGRINYNLDQKYILNLTARRDGSSRFGSGKQFANFGAIGAAWIFSEEGFIKNALPFISFGKLRGSYGTTGSDQIGNYQYLDTHTATNLPYLGTIGLLPTRLANSDFSWESNKKLEGGIELGFINDRIFLTTSYYRNRSSNQLTGIPLAGTTGFSTIQANFPATVENRGWEFELTTSNISTDDFQWTSSFNLTIPRNELLEFANIENSSFANTYTVGESLFNRKRFRYTGVDAETGVYTFEDLNEDGTINNDDLQSVKEIAPNYFGGFQNNISFKGFDLSFFFQFVNQTGINYLASFGVPGAFGNQPTIVLDRWRQEGDITDIQRFGVLDGNTTTGYENAQRSTQIISDASFIRLQNVMLSYSFPSSIIDKIKLQDLRVYVQGQNLLTITDYIGLDPETQSSQVLPPLRVITAGIQFKL